MKQTTFLKTLLLAFAVICVTTLTNAQNNVAIGTTTPDASAKLDVTSTTQGILVPRMTQAQRNLITTPATGLLLWQTDATPGFYFYNGTTWTSLSATGGSDSSQLQKITEGGNTGWRLKGFNPANYGNIGSNAIDLSSSSLASAINGATGNSSTAFGVNVTASGFGSSAFGFNTTASGNLSFATGTSTISSGSESYATGNYSEASGASSTAKGFSTKSKGNVSEASGDGTIAKSYAELAIGTFNDTLTAANQFIYAQDTNRVFTVGIGTNFTGTPIRKTAFVIQRDGNVGINQRRPSEKLDIAGSIKIVDGTQGAGKVLTSDASGKASWQTAAGGSSFFNVSTANTSNIIYSSNANYGKNFIVNADSVNYTNGSGFQYKMMFIPSKYAFRAGTINSKSWDVDSIGTASAAFGGNTKAKGTGSTAMGGGTTASGEYSTALGNGTIALGNVSTAMGQGTNASGATSTAMGFNTTASGQTSTTMGSFTIASGQNSTAMGEQTTASGFNSTAMGWNTAAIGTYTTAMGFQTKAKGNFSSAMGFGTISSSPYELAIGNYNDTLLTGPDRVFTVGNGTSTTRNTAFVIQQNGRVGINTGTTTLAKAMLEVTGNVSYNGGNFGWHNSAGNGGTSTGAQDYSIWASNRIAATEFNAFSDKRIKNVIGVTNNTNDLNTLSQIRITDYTMKDKVQYGNKAFKKVIAQELKTIYPLAVNVTTNTIPSIYQKATIQNGWIALETDLVKGDIVKIVTANSNKEVTVEEVSKGKFKVALEDGEVFVYGKQVNDFHTVDYEALTTLNISATQALLKRIQELESQVKEMASLKSDIEAIKAQLKISAVKASK